MAISYRRAQLLANFLIWHKGCSIFFVVSKIAQMNQISYNVIPVLNFRWIILKACCVDLDLCTR